MMSSYPFHAQSFDLMESFTYDGERYRYVSGASEGILHSRLMVQILVFNVFFATSQQLRGFFSVAGVVL